MNIVLCTTDSQIATSECDRLNKEDGLSAHGQKIVFVIESFEDYR